MRKLSHSPGSTVGSHHLLRREQNGGRTCKPGLRWGRPNKLTKVKKSNFEHRKQMQTNVRHGLNNRASHHNL